MYEKPRAPKATKTIGDPNEIKTVDIEDTGNKIDQRRLMGVYKSLGFGHSGQEEDGTILMSQPKAEFRKRYLADQQEARDRLIKTQNADRAEFGGALIKEGSGVVLKRESAQEAYERSVEIDKDAGFALPTGPRTSEDKFDEA